MYSFGTIFLCILHQLLTYSSVYYFLLSFIQGPVFSYETVLYLIPPIVITCLFLPKAKTLLQFLLLHGIFFPLPFLYANSTFLLILHLFLLLLMTVLHYVDLRAGLQKAFFLTPGFRSCLLYPVIYFYGHWEESTLLCQFAALGFALSISLWLLYQFLDNRHTFMERHKDISDLPTRQIYKVTHFIMVLFFSVLFMTIAMVLMSGIGNVLGIIFSSLGNSLRHLLNLYFSETPVTPEDILSFPEMNLGASDSAPNPLLELITTILTYFFMFILGVLILVGAGLGIYRAFAHFRNLLPSETDKVEFLTPFSKTEFYHSDSKARSSLFASFSPNSQVRKWYRKTILSHKEKKQKLSPAQTPEELERSVKLHNKLLHDLYEKARYSQMGCTQQDVEQLKGHTKS